MQIPNLKEFAINLLSNNPRVQNNPQAQEMLNVIISGDEVKGQQIANNLCSTYGVDQKTAVEKAQRFFHFF